MSMLFLSRSLCLPALALLVGFTAGARQLADAEPAPKAFAPGGYEFDLEVTVPVKADAAWDAFTGDVSAWWDHHFAKSPKSLVIARKPGGSFLEIFDDDGQGVEHARVTHAIRGELLRLVGPFGLVGHGVEIDTTLRFLGDGDQTQVRLVTYVTGKVDQDIAKTVEQVWRHFLIDQYAAHVRGG